METDPAPDQECPDQLAPCGGLSSADLFALDAALVGRITKWDDWKRHPNDHLHGCDPKWFEGWCQGMIEELQSVREMLFSLKSGKSIDWATPDANAKLRHGANNQNV